MKRTVILLTQAVQIYDLLIVLLKSFTQNYEFLATRMFNFALCLSIFCVLFNSFQNNCQQSLFDCQTLILMQRNFYSKRKKCSIVNRI